MKKLFRIVLIVCPLVNFGLLMLLSARNPEPETTELNKKEEPAIASQAPRFVNAVTSEGRNGFDALRVHSSPRLYFIEHTDCLEQ